MDIIDARTPNFYSGETPGRNQRPGHIPGAANVPYLSLVDEPASEAVETLQQQFRAAGVKAGDRVVSYCHIGQQATVRLFRRALPRVRRAPVRRIVRGWSRHSELPVEK